METITQPTEALEQVLRSAKFVAKSIHMTSHDGLVVIVVISLGWLELVLFEQLSILLVVTKWA